MSTSSANLIKTAGITPRQLNHWVTKGYLKPIGNGLTGSGHPFEFPTDQVRIAVLMGELTRAGLTPAAARLAADQLRNTGRARIGGFSITYTPASAA